MCRTAVKIDDQALVAPQAVGFDEASGPQTNAAVQLGAGQANFIDEGQEGLFEVALGASDSGLDQKLSNRLDPTLAGISSEEVGDCGLVP